MWWFAENTMMQAHLSRLALNEVLTALRNHGKEADIQAKGMVVLGVLGQVGTLDRLHIRCLCSLHV